MKEVTGKFKSRKGNNKFVWVVTHCSLTVREVRVLEEHLRERKRNDLLLLSNSTLSLRGIRERCGPLFEQKLLPWEPVTMSNFNLTVTVPSIMFF